MAILLAAWRVRQHLIETVNVNMMDGQLSPYYGRTTGYTDQQQIIKTVRNKFLFVHDVIHNSSNCSVWAAVRIRVCVASKPSAKKRAVDQFLEQ